MASQLSQLFHFSTTGWTSVQTILVALLDWRYYALIVSVSLVLFYAHWHKSSLPAGPIPVPVLGNLLQLGREPHLGLQRLSERHGDIFTVYIGSSPHLVLCSLQAIREVLVKHGDKTAGRPPIFANAFIKEHTKKGTLSKILQKSYHHEQGGPGDIADTFSDIFYDNVFHFNVLNRVNIPTGVEYFITLCIF